jgi:hypothetical protein
MANGVAPVCHIIRSQVPPDPKRQPIPPIRRATDPTSAVDTVNQIKDVLDQVLHNDNQPEWVEVERNTQRVRIHNATNYNQWVEVERITRVVFQNKVTAAKLAWQYRY